MVKQQINHGTIQRLCHLHNGIFHPIHLHNIGGGLKLILE